MSKSKNRKIADLISGGIDSRNVTTDGTKLDGVETGATADQTKADIDALNVNADLLDGQHGAYYTGYTDTAVAGIVDSSPAALNTLNELAAALGDDANYATTTATSIGTKLPKSGGAMTGAITTNSTFDGRNVSVDGTKLDGIAAGATNISNNNQLTNGAGYITSFTNTTYTADGNYGITLSGTTFRLEDDRRRNATYADVKSGNTHDYTFYDASIGIKWFTAGLEEMRLENDGDLHVDGNIIAYSTTVSDERLKTDIVKIDGALDKVAQLNGYTFTYTADGKKSAGVIAQEVKKVLPSAITESTLPLKMGEDDETEYMTVQYDQLIGLMIEAVKELKAEVAELKGK
jgi:hypothetical protein